MTGNIRATLRAALIGLCLGGAPRALAQEGLQIHGNFSTDGYLYQEDSAIGAVPPPEEFGLNAWSNIIATYGSFETGIRIENYTPALLGYPAGAAYTGTGIGYRYVKYAQDDLEVTAGSFFEQFGSGLVLRSYEERYLGVDNAMDGVRLKYKPYRGIYLKAFAGEQRLAFDNGFTTGTGLVRGIDAEVQLNELCDSMATRGHNLVLGGSFVSKFQEDKDPLYEFPENVGAAAARINYITPRWNLYAEYARKINDPNLSNSFTQDSTLFYNYKEGQALMLNATYSVKGFGASAGWHTYDNMVYRSDRSAGPFDLNINFLPTLAKQHTYNLAATLYPYATQPNGEVAYQGELFHKWKKGSKLGGKYGTKLALNGSVAYSLDSTAQPTDTIHFIGYTADPFAPGEELYFRDVNVEVRKKLSERWEMALTYIDLAYNIDVVQGKPGQPVIYAGIVVLEGLFQYTDENSLRFELQHLNTRQDHGNWATALAEFTFSPHWSLTAMDQYNYGGSVDVEEIHYPLGSAVYTRGANRFQVSYGRQRAGIFCVGGVCRQVPAASGLSLSITSTF